MSALAHVQRASTVCEAFQVTCLVDPDTVAFRTPGDIVAVTWREYDAQVRALAAGLHALGVRRGDTVALMLVNRPEFAVVDTAAMHLGAATVSLYNTSSREQLAYVLEHSEAKVLITERSLLDVVRGSGVTLEHVVCVDGEAEGVDLTLEELATAGEPGFDFDAAWQAVRPEDTLTLIYTSGTTGRPKGVQITHANVLAAVRGVVEVAPFGFGDRITSFLPAAHIADRVSTLYWMAILGLQVTYVADTKAIIPALVDTRPTVWFAVPRIWEKFRAALEARVAAHPEDGRSLPERAAELRAAIGLDELRFAICGSAPVAAETLAFFEDLGIAVVEVWGMTETTGIGTINPPGKVRTGTVGVPLPGNEVRLAEDGELLFRGPVLTPGYRGAPEQTAEAIDADGWMHTGDVATIDPDGYVRIVDRKKEIMISAAGKNMSPANIENALKAACPVIGAVVAVGDGRPFNVALVTLDPDAAGALADRLGIGERAPEVLAAHPQVQSVIAAGIEGGNASLSRAEQVKRHLILPTFWEPGGDELTPTLKLRRRPISEKYAAQIDALYAEGATR